MSVLSVGVVSRITMPVAREDTSSALVTGFKTEQPVIDSVAGGLPLWRETVPDILLLRHCGPRLGVRDATEIHERIQQKVREQMAGKASAVTQE